MRKPTALERFLVEWSSLLDEPPLPPLDDLEAWLSEVGKFMYILENDPAEWFINLNGLWKEVKKEENIG